MSHLYLENSLLGPPFCSSSSLRPTLVSITWKRRWEEMGRDQLTALKEKAGGSWRLRTFFHCTAGVCFTQEGAFLAHAHSWSTAEPTSRGEGASWRMRTLFTALRRLLCGCAGLAPSRKLEGWAGELVRGVGLSFSPAPPSAGAYSPQVFILWHVTASTDHSLTIQVLPLSIL